jgi:hypothetical protein
MDSMELSASPVVCLASKARYLNLYGGRVKPIAHIA